MFVPMGTVGSESIGHSGRLAAIVSDYVSRFRRPADRELAYFRACRTDVDAVSDAALARLPSGKRHPHQRRIPRAVLEESRARLLENLPLLERRTTFDELHELVERLIGSIAGIGELAVYDTTLRIGARFGLAPAKVYLHAGTRIGARALGLDSTKGKLEMADLPPELRTLPAREVEDVLCIYKDDFVKQGPVATTEGDTGVGCEVRERTPPAGCFTREQS